ncbi:MAG: STAS domain-containing protein [Fibrobacterota bacterium]
MDVRLSKSASDFFGACELAKSITGETPNPGTQCWIFVMDDNGGLNRQCEKCPYRTELTPESSVTVAENGNAVTITLKGEINEKRALELKKIMDAQLKTKTGVFVDCAGLSQIEPVALGILLRTYKILKEKNNEFFLIAPSDALLAVLQSTMLIKIMPAVRSMDEASHFINKKQEAVRTGEAKAQEEAKIKRLEEAKSVRCWDYFKGQNPQNATPCMVCHYKASGSGQPCWIIQGEIEGTTFEYVNEDCLTCDYFLKFNPEGDVEIVS